MDRSQASCRLLAGDAVNPLDLRGVQVRYGSGQTALTAVAGVDLAVAVGQTHGLVGESGSGKSTLARAVVGLQPVTGGCIHVSGTDVTKRAGRRSRTCVAGCRWCSRIPMHR